ncbi:MAG: glycosyltransferase [Phycisphaerae bacterium]
MGRDPTRVIVHVVHSLQGGGTERTLVGLLRSFDAAGFRHVVVTLRAAGDLAGRLPDHVAVYPLEAVGRARHTPLLLARLLRRTDACLVHARNTGCWWDATLACAMARRARLILGFHGMESAGGFSRRQRRWARLGLRVGGRFTTVSEAGREQLQCQVGVPAERIEVLPNGVDTARFRPCDPAVRRRVRRNLGFDDDAFVVGCVGSLTPVKQPETLIRAAALLRATCPGLRLLLVGDGTMLGSLQRLTRACGVEDRVRFTGWREDVARLLGSMDAYVCASASEGMSNALLEAMAVGLPVVTTRVGDHDRIVRDHRDGLVLSVDTPECLGDVLARWAVQPSMCGRFGVSARRRAAQFSFDQTVRRYEAFYARRLKIEKRASPHPAMPPGGVWTRPVTP